MDEIVKAALRKWPDVPACHGWLGLDARGAWYLRDLSVQSAGPFPQARGSRIEHAALIAFIGRNYESDASGCWYFQNGPQRVFVELEAAPLVLGVHRIDGRWSVQAHTGAMAGSLRGAYVDELGRLFLDTERGPGLVRSTDMHAAADAIEQGEWEPREVRASSLPARLGFCLSPAALARR